MEAATGAEALKALAETLGPRCQRDVPLGARTTYQVGGRAALLVEATDEDDLRRLSEALGRSPVPVLVLGRGSNLLVADRGFAGVVVTLSRDGFGRVHSGSGPGGGHDEPVPVVAGGSLPLPVLARQCAAAGLRGMEWAVGVPGSVGGAVRMNAGGHGADTASTLLQCRLVDLAGGTGDLEVWSNQDLAFGYRQSAVGHTHVVVDAHYRLRYGSRDEAEAIIRDILRWRREHQPGGQNAGSVFVNPGGEPPGNSAGWLVESAGLKGHRVGTAAVSDKHANFIQADPGGSADDVAALMVEVQRLVRERLGVTLRAEMRLCGFSEGLLSTLGLLEG